MAAVLVTVHTSTRGAKVIYYNIAIIKEILRKPDFMYPKYFGYTSGLTAEVGVPIL